jgi:hypothetical protein
MNAHPQLVAAGRDSANPAAVLLNMLLHSKHVMSKVQDTFYYLQDQPRSQVHGFQFANAVEAESFCAAMRHCLQVPRPRALPARPQARLNIARLSPQALGATPGAPDAAQPAAPAPAPASGNGKGKGKGKGKGAEKGKAAPPLPPAGWEPGGENLASASAGKGGGKGKAKAGGKGKNDGGKGKAAPPPPPADYESGGGENGGGGKGKGGKDGGKGKGKGGKGGKAAPPPPPADYEPGGGALGGGGGGGSGGRGDLLSAIQGGGLKSLKKKAPPPESSGGGKDDLLAVRPRTATTHWTEAKWWLTPRWSQAIRGGGLKSLKKKGDVGSGGGGDGGGGGGGGRLPRCCHPSVTATCALAAARR